MWQGSNLYLKRTQEFKKAYKSILRQYEESFYLFQRLITIKEIK